ncbi:MAG: 2-oxo-4-hydroxy-4-carboxy-5-ureidoimidazoline decarboxylase [Flavobacteriales bacterium]|nr:2-oxo-4-hydroxy-4-carboxy-5-ureidoimidazoline decarboxylase [Flavobacteriales bacterium]MCC6937427.1 2-oxo-4-hydroxy-4-carboxy-5-ureidoimidazoline decarboxylase [Flavobacteriales bacterium]
MTIDQLNRLSEADATTAFEQCCGAAQWMERMVFARPFEQLSEVLETSDTIWEECDVDDYEEAFTHHPRIGDVESLAKKYANTKTWAAGEQKGVDGADHAVIEKLATGNTTYEEKFGHIFIVCATGKSAAEMLAILEARIKNDPKDEILIAAGEQNKITRLRLKKLLA